MRAGCLRFSELLGLNTSLHFREFAKSGGRGLGGKMGPGEYKGSEREASVFEDID